MYNLREKKSKCDKNLKKNSEVKDDRILGIEEANYGEKGRGIRDILIDSLLKVLAGFRFNIFFGPANVKYQIWFLKYSSIFFFIFN